MESQSKDFFIAESTCVFCVVVAVKKTVAAAIILSPFCVIPGRKRTVP